MQPVLHDEFSKLLAQHQRIVHKVAHAYAWNSADRADLTQEIAAQLWRAYPRYDRARRFSTWMYRIALNVAISYVRHAVRQHTQTVPLDHDAHDTADVSVTDPEIEMQLLQLRQVIEALDPLNRALMLLYLDEHSNHEIAEILGLTETNVSTKISRLKQTIRKHLDAAPLSAKGPCHGTR